MYSGHFFSELVTISKVTKEKRELLEKVRETGPGLVKGPSSTALLRAHPPLVHSGSAMKKEKPALFRAGARHSQLRKHK